MSVFVPNPWDSVPSSAHSVLLVFTFLILHGFSLQTLRAQQQLPQWQWTKVRQWICTKPAKGQGQLEPWAAEALNLTAQLREVMWSLCDIKLALSRKDNCMGQIPSGCDDVADWYSQGSLSSWGCTSLSTHDLRCSSQDRSHWSSKLQFQHDIPCTQQTEIHIQSVGIHIIYTCAYT